MQVFLVRHAHAVSEEQNAARPLSERGQSEVRRLAAFFRTNGAFAPGQIWHSPLLRARETAERLSADLELEAALVETADLRPEDEPEEIARRLSALSLPSSLAIVGHEPHLSALASLLVRGRIKPALVDMKKGAVLALRRTEDVHKKTGEPRWEICWMVVPGLLNEQPPPAERV